MIQTSTIDLCETTVGFKPPLLSTSGLKFSYDIFLGRGSSNSWRPGNTLFHRVLDSYAETYHAATEQSVKSQIVETIYETIRRWGRFLENDPKTNVFAEIGKGDAN